MRVAPRGMRVVRAGPTATMRSPARITVWSASTAFAASRSGCTTAALTISVLWAIVIGRGKASFFVLFGFVMLVVVIVGATSHVRRVRLIADRVDPITLSSRQRRRIEIPLPAGEAFALVEAAIRELPL